jgi:hypothetical protein
MGPSFALGALEALPLIRCPSCLRLLLVCLVLPFPTYAHAQAGPVPVAACTASAPDPSAARESARDLAGLWDFRIDMGSAVATGTMALGHMDGAYAGALTPDATNTVAIRKLTVTGDSLHMSVASREGEVLFHGRLLGAGDTMCGIVTYHGGVRFPMTATYRPRVRGE